MNNDWYAENELRAYPVEQTFTDSLLPDSVLSDLVICLGTIEPAPYISSVTVTPTIASITITQGGTTIAACTVPVNEKLVGVGTALQPLAPYVSGFVVFGSGILNTLASFVGDEVTGKINPRCIMYTPGSMVTSLKKQGSNTKLTGVVKLVAGNNIEINRSGDAIIVSLTPGSENKFLSVLDKVSGLGSCGDRPPLRTINGIGPDINGVITIEVNNAN